MPGHYSQGYLSHLNGDSQLAMAKDQLTVEAGDEPPKPQLIAQGGMPWDYLLKIFQANPRRRPVSTDQPFYTLPRSEARQLTLDGRIALPSHKHSKP